MSTLFDVLRLFHIVAGILWVGALVMMAFFIGPTARALGPAGGAMIDHLVRVRKVPRYMMTMAIITVLAGLGLTWLHVSATSGEWMRTSMGRTFMWGGTLAIVGFIWGAVFVARAAGHLAGRAKALADAGHPPSDQERAELQHSSARLGFHTRAVAVLLLLASALMATARYMP